MSYKSRNRKPATVIKSIGSHVEITYRNFERCTATVIFPKRDGRRAQIESHPSESGDCFIFLQLPTTMTATMTGRHSFHEDSPAMLEKTYHNLLRAFGIVGADSVMKEAA